MRLFNYVYTHAGYILEPLLNKVVGWLERGFKQVLEEDQKALNDYLNRNYMTGRRL